MELQRRIIIFLVFVLSTTAIYLIKACHVVNTYGQREYAKRLFKLILERQRRQSNEAKCAIWSGPVLFALHKVNLPRKQNEMYPDKKTLKIAAVIVSNKGSLGFMGFIFYSWAVRLASFENLACRDRWWWRVLVTSFLLWLTFVKKLIENC